MEQEAKVHLKRFAERLQSALGYKTSWGRNQLYRLVDETLIDYLIHEGDLEMEEAGAVELMHPPQAEEEEIVLRKGQEENEPTLEEEESVLPPM